MRTNKGIVAAVLLALMSAAPLGMAAKQEDTVTKPTVNDGGLAALNCSLGSATVTLTEGVSVTGSLPALSGSSCDFVFTPAAGSDVGRIVLSGLSSDFDLYVKRGSPPTTTSWECRPFSGGTTVETCDLMTTGVDFYAMVRRFSGSGSFTVTATSITLPELMNGVPQTSTVATGAMQVYKVVVPVGATRVSVAIAGEPGALVCAETSACSPSMFTDADLYVRLENVPTTSLFSCRSWAFGNEDSCHFDTGLFTAVGDPVGDPVDIEPFLGAGRYIVGVRGYDGPADYGVVAVYS